MVRPKPFLFPPPPPSWANFHVQLLRAILLIGAARDAPVTRALRQRRQEPPLATIVLPLFKAMGPLLPPQCLWICETRGPSTLKVVPRTEQCG